MTINATYEKVLELGKRYGVSGIIEQVKKSDYENITRLWKILSNSRIMTEINSTEIANFLESVIKEDDSTYEKICELVRRVYGQDAEKILRERPNLSIRDIPNFDIFEDIIRDVIGYGGIHTFLTYDMSSEHIITELVQNPESIKYYKEFEKMTDTFYPPSAIGLEERLIAFYEHRELIKEILDSGRINEYLENLLLMLRDLDGLKMLERRFLPEKGLNVNSLEELKNYKIRREDFLKGYMESVELEERDRPGQIIYYKRNMILFKYFGILHDRPGEYNSYSHKKVLQDYSIFSRTQLTDDDVDLIEIYSIIEEIEDLELLEAIDRFMAERDNIVTPLHMKAIDSRVIESYKSTYIDSLITVDKAKQMAEDPNDKSYRYIVKKNGDIHYPTHRYCKEDNTCRYEDYIQMEDGRKIYYYIGPNQQIVTKIITTDPKTKEERQEYIFQDFSSVIMKNGEIEEFSYKGCIQKKQTILRGDRNGYIPLSPERFSEGYYNVKFTSQYLYLDCQTGEPHWIWFDALKEGEEKYGHVVEFNTRAKYYHREYERRDEVLNYIRNFIEPELRTRIQEFESSLNRSTSENGYQIVKQYNPENVTIEEGDVEGFVLYGISPRQQCVTMIRDGGVTSWQLRQNKFFRGRMKSGAIGGVEFVGGEEEKIQIEKELESGITTRSAYYAHTPDAWKIGLAFTGINPNAILGYCRGDAGTSHTIKDLRPSMLAHGFLSNILDCDPSHDAEIAFLRYEYDIGKIKERNCRRES